MPQVLHNTATKTTDLVIFNNGGGVARGTSYALTAAGQKAVGMIGDGFLHHAVKVYIHTDLPASDDAECVVMWRNVDESSWAVSRTSARRRMRKGREGPVTKINEAWRRFYPRDSLDGKPRTTNVNITFEHPA